MKISQLIYLLVFITFTSASQAELLWDNGPHANNGIGLNNQYQSVMDDFYVPGGGWFINSIETHGIFLNPNRIVSDVDIIIWPADTTTGEPNGDHTFSINVINFEAIDTGLDWGGYDKIKITVNFDNTYLQGQEYYWIELDIKDQYGERIKLLEKQNVNYLPAHIRSNPYPFSSEKDLAYRLFGTDIKVVYLGGSNEFTLEKIDPGHQIVTLELAGTNKRLNRGIYQIQHEGRQVVMYRFDEHGKQLSDFKPNPKAPARMSTPIGDDLCGNIGGSLQDFCQSFVACAAYDLFCPGL